MNPFRRSIRALAGALVTIRTEPIEIPLLDLREALAQASALLGVDVGDAVLDRIFATFCVGK